MDGRESPLFRESFLPRRYQIEQSDLEIYGYAAIFEATGATEWIASHRLPRRGPLDVAATAESLGIPLSFDLVGRMASGKTSGIPGSKEGSMPLSVHLRPQTEAGDNVISFSHELGHIYLGVMLGMNHPANGHDSEVEAYCEAFGREMAMPRTELLSLAVVDESVILDLIHNYGVDTYIALYQLALAGKIPKKVRVFLTTPEDSEGRHAGQIVDNVFCLDCSRHTGLCVVEDEAAVTELRLIARRDSLKMRASDRCQNQKDGWRRES